jgi:hypothetical protein
MIMYYLNNRFLFLFWIFISYKASAQSFNDEKTAAINFIKRVYNASPFDGGKKIEGEGKNYFAVAVTLPNIITDANTTNPQAQEKAQKVAEVCFAEPCIKFEMIDYLEKANTKQITYLFLCETLADFVYEKLNSKIFDGARIISAPNKKYIVSVVTLDNSKYTSPEMRDKAAFMKAKQFVNTMVNGSTISSDLVLRTDENDKQTAINSTETIREQAMGFIQGLEILDSKELTTNKTTYIYYSKI